MAKIMFLYLIPFQHAAKCQQMLNREILGIEYGNFAIWWLETNNPIGYSCSLICLPSFLTQPESYLFSQEVIALN